jgi:DNA polymerase
MANRDECLRAIVVGRLESLERAGVRQLPKRPARLMVSTADVEASPAAVAEAGQAADESATLKESSTTKSTSWRHSTRPSLFEDAEAKANSSAATQAPSLAVLQQEVAACTRCSELAKLRTQTVFGVGNPQARLCFMGEAPGADEDRLGEPFVGRAGQLLTKIIEACKMKREDVYILNMIKCRPPGNRNPLPDELANCRGFLERQLELIEPEYICCLGAVAAQNLLNTTTSISKLRGKLHVYRGAKVVCTFHPAYLLRNPAAKKDAWEDMKFLLREMGVEL